MRGGEKLFFRDNCPTRCGRTTLAPVLQAQVCRKWLLDETGTDPTEDVLAKETKAEQHWRRIRLFNYAKRAIMYDSEVLGREVQFAEGLVRCMASSVVVGAAGVIGALCFYVLAYAGVVSAQGGFGIWTGLLIANSALFVSAAIGIGNMRQYEAEVVVASFFIAQGRRNAGK